MKWFEYEYILLLSSKIFIGFFVLFIFDLIFQLGLLGSNLKKKWIIFLKGKKSEYKIAFIGFLLFLFFAFIFDINII